MAVTRAELEAESQELADQLAAGVRDNPAQLGQLAKRKAEVDAHLALLTERDELTTAITDAESLLNDPDPSMQQMAQAELTERKARLETVVAELQELERPRDPDDDKPAIIEIRAGAGGDEASLFAGELFSMYQRFSEEHGFGVEVMSRTASEAGGAKEVIFRVAAPAYGWLRFEAGTHRVQRIPVTESGGRIHTSTATVIVLPEAEEVDIEIKPDEIKTDVYRSSGPGGQSVNTTDSAVRLTHTPTGLVVTCQDEKSQHKNKAKAMTILRSRLKQQRDEEEAASRGEQRRSQVGSGDRSEKIRTYNVPQDRVTDHRIGYSTRGLDQVLAGKLDSLIEKLRVAAEES